MPALTVVNIKKPGNTGITIETLDGSDTFSISATGNESLILTNPTGADITCTLTGTSAPATVFCDGVGTIAVSPESVTVAAGETESVYLSSLSKKLAGGVTIGSGAGLEASLNSY